LEQTDQQFETTQPI